MLDKERHRAIEVMKRVVSAGDSISVAIVNPIGIAVAYMNRVNRLSGRTVEYSDIEVIAGSIDDPTQDHITNLAWRFKR